MKIPTGLREYGDDVDPDTDCVQLLQSIYGLVQAARQWWKRFVKSCKKLGFQQSLSDPCLLYRSDVHGEVILIMYVDDVLTVGDETAIRNTVSELEKEYKLKIMDEDLTDYLGCKIEVDKDNKMLKLTQPDLIKRMNKKYGEEVKNLQNYRTPAAPGEIMMRPQNPNEFIGEEQQTEYRSGVGMLLYLVKHSRPELSNCVRELAKVMDGATQAHVKSLMRAIKFVLDTKEKGLVMEPDFKNFKWVIESYCDSDYSGDRETRKSVTGYIIYLIGAAIAWKSRGQKSVSLSSTEAEYISISEVCTDIMFIKGILEFLGIKVELPIIVHVDNIGAIYMSNNATTSTRTKHVDVRYHYVKEYIEDGIVKIIFVRSKDNKSDIFTKNTNQEIYERHSREYSG
jgi:hypothetical protein